MTGRLWRQRPIPHIDGGLRMPPIAKWLGYAGLLPQLWALTVLLVGNPESRFTALALGYAYAALILSFLGGMWWGLAAQARAVIPAWVWGAAIAPSLIALASTLPWAVGARWPGPSLALLGGSLLASLAVDYSLAAAGLCPNWWLKLRVPLSVGLGGLTLWIGYFA
ncbi:DUF3429 domain-containing protein [Sphingomonas sp. SUN019]|uniref:DUF3429 domain-containing protein n=1 Tax=Sphingomonas sp. SUN019 TaxID=2937788 RepID=UPI002164878E|nr:DUF3429 domain-containing protein [Sphingomonas sp. SUN019]UVO50101.1 DUF3429 domain-containing protein [Sphingomonas sp. SUN019]